MLTGSGSTSDRDLGAKVLLARVKELHGAVVEAGLFDGEKRPEGGELTVAQIGTVHEFGLPSRNIPERSWLRRAVRERGAAWGRMLDDRIELIVAGQAKVFPSLVAFGEKVASDIRATIDQVLTPPKAEATIRAEGGPLRRTKTGKVKKGAREYQRRFTHPLIWTGLMRASVRARIALLGAATKLTAKGGGRR